MGLKWKLKYNRELTLSIYGYAFDLTDLSPFLFSLNKANRNGLVKYNQILTNGIWVRHRPLHEYFFIRRSLIRLLDVPYKSIIMQLSATSEIQYLQKLVRLMRSRGIPLPKLHFC
jgi:hypothetical protein